MLVLYTATIFLSAALLFVVQPMFARMVLPLLGGSPAVWNTAMVFYQAALLGGYAYAHATTARLGVRRQAVLHLAVLLLPLAFLPIAIRSGWTPPTDHNPIPWMLGLMTVTIGLPFFAVSTGSPVLQKWFAATGQRQSADPYFLYAASNVGSMLALLSYPVLIEPHLRLADQSRAWAWGYGALVVLTGACAVHLWQSSPAIATASQPSAVAAPVARISPRRRASWVMLSFVPSSLLLGVTTYLSTEIAAVPLMWVVPLAIYLLTFILAFARKSIFFPTLLARALPILIVALVMAIDMQASEPIGGLMALHLAVFFVAALLCHGRLAADRPPTAHLTEFYLWMSVGGVLGGMFNALLAPLLFNAVIEYPVTLVLACAVGLAPAVSGGTVRLRWTWLDWVGPALLGGLATGLMLWVQASRFRTDPTISGLVFGLPALICYFFSRRPRRFVLGISALLIVGSFYEGQKGRVLYAERTFFGVHRVTLDTTGQYHLLVHGKTLHGMQSLDPARRLEPLAYYYRSGPIGQVMQLYAQDPSHKIGVVGLGAGSLASYAQPGQSWTYFEIDPVVLKLARDNRFFTFLHDSPANMRVLLGDARLSLTHEPDGAFDLLLVDAYSSDAIPVHLVTREALALYLRKLAPGGLLAFHISNWHLNLEPVFANLARDAGLVCLVRDDTAVPPALLALGKSPSVWLVMSRQSGELAPLLHDPRWQPGRRNDQQAVWTDDYSSLLSVFRWR
jgi:spermidine synthase